MAEVGTGERGTPARKEERSMYTFAVIALLALGTVKLVDFLADNVPYADRLRSLLTFVIAIGAVLALRYSMFDGWGIAVRNDDLGRWITGFCVVGGGVPLAGEIVLSTRRLDAIGAVDGLGGQVTAGAGATLAAVQAAADIAGWAVGIDLAARDSATVGGMVATNAGGLNFLRRGG